jgi:hypothetical protein
MIFDADEKIVLDDGYVGYKQKLTLTNKRLIYSKKAGWFKADWVRVDEILLDDIEEAYTHTSGGLAQSSSAMLKMKNGTVRELNVHTGSVDALGMLVAADTATDMAVRTKTLCDKWVSAVNQQLRLKTENRTETLEKRIRELEEKLKEK